LFPIPFFQHWAAACPEPVASNTHTHQLNPGREGARTLAHTGATPKVVQEQLRHADPCVTIAMYSHVIGDDRRNAVERVAKLLRPNAPKLESESQFVQ
jgi:hypothetical protein